MDARMLRLYREWYYGNHQFSAIRATFHFQPPAQGLSGFANGAQADARIHAGGSGKNPWRVEPAAIIADAEKEALLRLLVANGYLPVVACVAGDREGRIYNVNADQMAVACAA